LQPGSQGPQPLPRSGEGAQAVSSNITWAGHHE
jgi:hypothetical protein